MYTVIFLTVSLLSLTYSWLKYKYSYWERRSVKSPKPVPFIGNFAKVFFFRESITTFTRRIYNDFKNEPIVGFYRGINPGLVVQDPELIKHVMIKDFHFFQNRGLKVSDDNIAQNLFLAEDDQWRVLRHKLTPIFTSGKLKNMMSLISRCVDDFIFYVDKLVKENNDHEIRDLSSKFTLEVIGACAFGVDMKTFSDKQNVFCETAYKLFNPSLYGRFKQLLVLCLPSFAIFLNKVFKIHLRNQKNEAFFVKLVSEIVQEREGKPKLRNDFMDLLIELKEQGKVSRHDEIKTFEIDIDVELISAQAMIFYGAGLETSAATMSFLMYELAVSPDIQERASDEVKDILKKYNGALSYEAIKDMHYLRACFDETLRKYPVAGQLFRCATERYNIPGTKVTIEKGTWILIPVEALHLDPKLFEKPEVFNPERFLGDNKSKITPCSYIPFGEGPRNCIGLRFSWVQSLAGIAAFLEKYKLEPSSKTKIPLTFIPKALTLTADGGIWLKILPRS